MTLSDREILELNELCDAVIEGTLSGTQRARLEQMLSDSEDARRYYVEAADLSASLASYASEMQMEAADGHRPLSRFLGMKTVRLGALAAAIAIAFAVWTTRNRGPAPEQALALPPPASPTEYVARLTGAKDSQWANDAVGPATGDFLRRGQRLKLASGFAEVTFDSGAVILMEGPATLDVNSAWSSTLRRGAIKAHVPAQALGFRVANPSVEVVDMGTEFSMVAGEHGIAEVFVLQGEVEAMPRGNEDLESIVLRANESRRFARSGISDTNDHDQMLARFRTSISLNRLSEPVKYVHWTFDRMEGLALPGAATAGFEKNDLAFRLSPQARSDDEWNLALRLWPPVRGNTGLEFDGDLTARANFPGISGDSPRTIAFWVKVREDAPLSSAYSMVAWRGDSAKLASRPVHIGWNRNPNEGPLGAVRTDFSGGHAMGTTPLRDNKWHFVTVIFLPGSDSDVPVQVKQYVDGRLESNTVKPGPKRSIGGHAPPGSISTLKDQLWLGCRLGASSPKQERFRGHIDELVIVDRGLEPAEIVELMDGRLFNAAPR